jgi:hypothetical protein
LQIYTVEHLYSHVLVDEPELKTAADRILQNFAKLTPKTRAAMIPAIEKISSKISLIT